MPQVVVTIDDKTYRMACDDGQEDHLIALAERFDRSLGQLRKSFGAIGDQRLTVMTGIMLVDQLSDAEAKIAEMSAKLDAMAEAQDGAAERAQRDADLARRVEEVTGQIGRIAQRLQAVKA